MGGMIPMITKLLMMLNSAKAITTRPAVLKKILFFELSRMLSELKLTRAKTGKVPRAKASMVSAPFTKLPVESV